MGGGAAWGGVACCAADFEDGLDGSSLGSVCLECEVGNAGVSGGDEVAWPPYLRPASPPLVLPVTHASVLSLAAPKQRRLYPLKASFLIEEKLALKCEPPA